MNDYTDANPHLQAHFQQLYQQDADPWKVRQRWYEQRKRSVLLACLPQQRYRRGYEPACGNGELTAALSRRVERLLASDFSAEAVNLARRRLMQEPDGDTTRVTICQQRLPQDWPDNLSFDLIVLSEILYYLDEAALLLMRERCVSSLEPGGTLLLCHWRHPFDDRMLATDEAHAIFGQVPGLRRAVRHCDDDFLIEAWTSDPAPSPQLQGEPS